MPGQKMSHADAVAVAMQHIMHQNTYESTYEAAVSFAKSRAENMVVVEHFAERFAIRHHEYLWGPADLDKAWGEQQRAVFSIAGVRNPRD